MLLRIINEYDKGYQIILKLFTLSKKINTSWLENNTVYWTKHI